MTTYITPQTDIFVLPAGNLMKLAEPSDAPEPAPARMQRDLQLL